MMNSGLEELNRELEKTNKELERKKLKLEHERILKKIEGKASDSPTSLSDR